jgi:hypothetical protein
MPTSPVKRYSPRSRNRALGGDHRTKLREQALDIAEKGLNRRGGPVDKGSPQAQKKAADQLRNELAQNLGEAQRQKQVERQDKKQTDQVEGRRSFQLHKNTTGNARSGQLFRTIAKKGGEIHEYQSGKRVFVKDKDGTGNRALKPTADGGSTAKQMISELAKRRSSENKPKAKRKLFRKAA